MQMIQDNYFTAYRSPNLTRNAEGVLTGALRRSRRLHSTLEGRIVREAGYGLSLEGASSAALLKSKQAKDEPASKKENLRKQRVTM